MMLRRRLFILVLFSLTYNCYSQVYESYRKILLSREMKLNEKKRLIDETLEKSINKEYDIILGFCDSILEEKIIVEKQLINWVKVIKATSLARQQKINEGIDLLLAIIPGKDKLLEITINARLARIYLVTSDYQKSLGYYQKNLLYYTVLKPDFGKQSAIYNSIQICYYRMGMPKQAEEAINKSIEAANKTGDSTIILNSYLAKAVFALSKNNCYLADSIYSAFEKLIQTKENHPQMTFYCNFSEAKYCLNQLRESEYYLEKSLHLAYEERDTFWVTINLVRKADILAKRNQNKEALKLCEKAYQFAVRKQSLIWQKNACNCIYEKNLRLKNYKEALESYLLLSKLKDSLFNEKNKREMTRKEFEFEFAKKATADSIVKAQQSIIKDAQIKAQQSELEREKTVRFALYGGGIVVLVFAGLIFNRYKLTMRQKVEIENQKKLTEKQKHLIEEKQKEIIDSINYARRIQYTLLAHETFLKNHLPEHFVFFHPKDIVSGDFYWATQKEDNFYLAVCDSTGHGVPGAFMSLLNISFINEAISERNILLPNEVFDYVRNRLIENMSKEDQKDGFDGILICMNKKTGKITYSAANNKPILISENTLLEMEADRMPVGIGLKQNPFTLHEVNYKKGDLLYLYTDGFADQFGGPKGKKYKYKALNEFLHSIINLPVTDQKKALLEEFNNWRGQLEQVDDVCIVGLRL